MSSEITTGVVSSTRFEKHCANGVGTVALVRHDPDALDLLLQTKNTRMGFDEDPSSWPEEKRLEHLAYMRDTIRSSWEFCDYVFEFGGVTRAFTHQLVRTRTGSYAQESQRASDVREHPVLLPASVKDGGRRQIEWEAAVEAMIEGYGTLIDQGVPIQDARGLLPTNVTTSIMAKFTLRTLHDMAKVRLCTRTQGEYQDLFRTARELVIGVHPWIETFRFMEVHCVAEGTCAFPRYGKKECRFYDPAMDLDLHKSRYHRKFWSGAQQEANPVAKNGTAVGHANP